LTNGHAFNSIVRQSTIYFELIQNANDIPSLPDRAEDGPEERNSSPEKGHYAPN
jgi:hypothetical protein